uniref:Chromo domain-containing protein n=1 Tax=Astyanax mexicanus TaxID=7994 RepID=A0A8B9H1J1_ASTMX
HAAAARSTGPGGTMATQTPGAAPSGALSRRKSGGPSAPFWEGPETAAQLEAVRSWIGKHYKKYVQADAPSTKSLAGLVVQLLPLHPVCPLHPIRPTHLIHPLHPQHLIHPMHTSYAFYTSYLSHTLSTSYTSYTSYASYTSSTFYALMMILSQQD